MQIRMFNFAQCFQINLANVNWVMVIDDANGNGNDIGDDIDNYMNSGMNNDMNDCMDMVWLMI